MGTKRKRSRLKDEYFLELQKNGEYIVDKYRDIIKQYTGFDLKFYISIDDINIKYINYPCYFYITSEDHHETNLFSNSVACSVYIYYHNKDRGIKYSRGAGVGSIIPGMRLGEIVFNLQFLLSIISGLKEVTLANFTDDPERSMEGIYKLFDINGTKKTRKEFTGKSKVEKLHLSDGEMKFILRSDSEDLWNENWEEIINKLKIKTELKGQAKAKKTKKKRKRRSNKSKTRKHKKKSKQRRKKK